jgi:site-specific recombinase XerD
VQGLLDDWMKAAGIASGSLFRRVSSADKVWGERVTEKLVRHVVKEFAAKIGVAKLAPHDLRRSCARLCRAAGGELEQIQFLLGHVSVQTTERYLGCIQRISSAVNDRIGIEPKT